MDRELSAAMVARYPFYPAQLRTLTEYEGTDEGNVAESISGQYSDDGCPEQTSRIQDKTPCSRGEVSPY